MLRAASTLSSCFCQSHIVQQLCFCVQPMGVVETQDLSLYISIEAGKDPLNLPGDLLSIRQLTHYSELCIAA